MIKGMFCTLALIGLAGTLTAQASFGIRAGAHIGKQTYDSDFADISLDSKVGLDLAILVELGISEIFAVQPELHYIQKGTKTDVFGTEVSTVLNYIDVPILGKLNFGENVKFIVEVGPSFGYAISGKNKAGDDSEDIDFDEEGYERFEVSGVIGAGVSLPVMNESALFIDIRYILGITNIAEDEDFSAKNTGFNIGVGIIF